MTGSGWKCCFVLDRVVMEDLSIGDIEERPEKNKRTSHVVILRNYMPGNELPRP